MAGAIIRALRSICRTVEGDRLANERLERGLVDVFSFVDVDRAAYVSVETRVEETGRILQRRALGEGQLHDILVGFARADDAVVRPNRGARFGWFDRSEERRVGKECGSRGSARH